IDGIRAKELMDARHGGRATSSAHKSPLNACKCDISPTTPKCKFPSNRRRCGTVNPYCYALSSGGLLRLVVVRFAVNAFQWRLRSVFPWINYQRHLNQSLGTVE